ncbi:MAG: hypothetical protein FWB80_08490 [Defluviitaleaceae bacterium]|nr:hypothetical protein [Defluviitaleaceae bacterium]
MRIRSGFPIGKNALLKHPLGVFAKIAVFVGLFLFVLGLVIAAFTTSGEDRLIVLLSVSSQGIVWWIIAAVMGFISYRNVRKLEFYKQEGKLFDAEITNLFPVAYINIGSIPTMYAECVYTNENDQRCKVKTPMFLWKNFRDTAGLKASVYVDYSDPSKYAVELTPTEENTTQVDIDYT